MVTRHQQRSELGTADPPPAVGAAIAELAVAHDYARDAGCDPWQFAVEISRLADLGLTNSDLRWLVEKGYATHAREITEPGDPTRKFVAGSNTAFARDARFLLTDAGLYLAGGNRAMPMLLRIADHASPMETASAGMPHWDSNDGTLHFCGHVVKRIRRPSPNQATVLTAFEEEGWPDQIDDPLPPTVRIDSKRRLHDTIKWLNRHHEIRVLCFTGDGTGEGVRWRSLIKAARAISADQSKRMRPAA